MSTTELREGYAELGDVRLHYVEAGEGPLVVLLHGFPEFWYGWRQQIEPLAAAGFRVVAPDMRGYNTPDLAEPHPDDVPNLVGVERLPNASNWVHHDEADRVTQWLTGFFAGQ